MRTNFGVGLPEDNPKQDCTPAVVWSIPVTSLLNPFNDLTSRVIDLSRV